MQLETFRGVELHAVVSQVRRTLGEDAMIVRTRVVRRSGAKIVEVVAARQEDVDGFKRRLDGGLAAARRARHRRRIGPYTLALVGPAGAGKTTTAVKLALHPRGLGRKRVGLITLDTYRVGALEELQTYAEIANIPLEVVYNAREIAPAVRRLRDVDVIVVDTPGRWTGCTDSWGAILDRIDADETHLVIPAGLRIEVALTVRERLESTGPTHVLFTKLDELPGDAGLAEMAEALALPARWVADGHQVPEGLAEAATRVLASLGIPEADVESARGVS